MFYFKENGNARFDRMDIEDTFFIEKKNGRGVRAWKNFYKLMLPFEGYKNVRRDMVTLAYARDIIYDPFNALSTEERPNALDIKPWVAEVLNGQRHKRQQEQAQFPRTIPPATQRHPEERPRETDPERWRK